MGREGYVVPVDPQMSVGLTKKPAGSRSWILLDSSGQENVLDLDKYSIMHRVQIHARDLRILDPLLSYPSTILGREKAIVLNLEVFFLHTSTNYFSCLFFSLVCVCQKFCSFLISIFYFLVLWVLSISRQLSLLMRYYKF